MSREIMSTVPQLRPTVAKERFDSNGARKAAIALLTAIYKTGRHGTMAEVLIALEVIDSNLDGRPHSMKSLSSKLGIPYTSVSRIVYSLTAEAQPGGVLKLVPDSKDRRRKHIELDSEAFKRCAARSCAREGDDRLLRQLGLQAQERSAELDAVWRRGRLLARSRSAGLCWRACDVRAPSGCC